MIAAVSSILPFWRPIAVGLAVAAALGGTYLLGRSDANAAWKAKETARQLVEARQRVQLQAKVDSLALELEEAQAKRQVITRIITKEVPRYVKEPAAPCVADGLHAPGFRVLYDAAAGRTAPDPAGVVAAAPVPAVPAATAIIDTIAGCHSAADQVDGWRAWWATVSKPN